MGLLSAIGGVVGTVFGGGPIGGAIGSALGGALEGNIAGNKAAAASRSAAKVQQQAANNAANNLTSTGERLFNPYIGLGERGVELSGFLGDPQAQFQFLQNNPLFQMGLDNLNQQTNKISAARGRLTAGDTLQQLTNNSLLAASPLIAAQRQDINNLLSIGQNGSQMLANTILNAENFRTTGAAAQAAGIVGANNAKQSALQSTSQLIDTAVGQAGGFGAIGDYIGGLFGGSTQPTGGSFSTGQLNVSQMPTGINTSAGSYQSPFNFWGTN
jgi:hypothetical protein